MMTFLLLLATGLLPAPVPPAVAEPVVFFVGPEGNDAWSGRLPEATADKTDGPFATPARAQKAARDARGAAPVRVRFRGGRYALEAPLEFAPEDSGTAERPVVFEAVPGEKPVLSGGRAIVGWKAVDLGGRRAWAAEVPEARDAGPAPWRFRALWVDGARAQRPRLPANGFLTIGELLDVDAKTPWHQGQTRFRAAPGDLDGVHRWADIEIVALHFWVESRMPASGFDLATRIVSLARRSVFRLTDDHRPDPARYYADNVFEALDAPGEWYLHRGQGVVYYVPQPGEDPARLVAIAPRLPAVVRFAGDPDRGRFVEHVVLRGLTFAHSEAECPPLGWPSSDVAGPPQAAVTSPGAIAATGMRSCAIEECTIEHVGSYGIALAGGCRDNRIVGCEIRDLAAGGIKIGETQMPSVEARATGGNMITDNRIHDGGLVHHSAVGILVAQSGGNVIAHNEIDHFFYTGLSVGWTWGYGPSAAAGNVIEKNHIHHIGMGLLSDMGAIYTLGVSPGTVVRGNLLHDVTSHGYGGWGLYFDEGTTGIVAENNVIYRTKSSCFHQHYGRENVLRNNILALGREAQIARSRAEEHLSFTFEGNIVWWNTGTLFSGNWEGKGYRFDRNCYFDARAATGPSPLPADWQARGQDQGSMVANPGLRDPEKGEFALDPASPARTLGFKPIDLSDVGPRRR